MAVNAPLQFLGFNVFRVVFERSTTFNQGEFTINVQFLTEHLNPEDKLSFQIVFIVTINSKTNSHPCNLQVQALGDFKVLGEVEQHVMDNYVQISAPSITYPYLRAFVSNLFLQSGMQPIILPPLNFTDKNPQPVNPPEQQESDTGTEKYNS